LQATQNPKGKLLFLSHSQTNPSRQDTAVATTLASAAPNTPKSNVYKNNKSNKIFQTPITSIIQVT